jgi:hypothetical protein
MPNVLPLTKRQKRQLAAVGISMADFAFFRRFIGHNFSFITKKEGRDWSLHQRVPLNNALLVSHLLGRRWVGTGCRWDASVRRFVTDYVAIDLDQRGDIDDLIARYDRVLAALGPPTFVFRSSEYGGLHLYYLLAEPIELHRLRRPDGRHGAVMELLAAHDLIESNGSIEVYPRGHYRVRGTMNRLRLPFGRGCTLLDPDSLLPYARAKAARSLEVARQFFEDEKVELTDATAWVRRSREVGTRPVAPRKPRTTSLTPTTSGSAPDTQRLRNDGLTAAKQFNAAILALAIELRRQDIPKDVASQDLCDWIDRHHNGRSRTYNRSRLLAHAEIGRIVGRVYARHVRRTWTAIRPLSKHQFRDLTRRLDGDFAIADPKTGELLKRYRVEQVAFELKRKGKQWVETMGQAQYDRVRRELPHVEPGAPEFVQEVLARCKPFWPDPTVPEFVVPVPYTLRANLDFISERAVWAPWRAVTTAGVFRPNRRASAWDQRAATYRVSLDFGAYDNAEPYDDVAVAIGAAFNADELRSRYSRHYATHIRKSTASETVRIGAAPVDGFVRLVRHVLVSAGHDDAISRGA